MAFKQPLNYSKNSSYSSSYSSSSNSSSEGGPNWKWREYSINYLPKIQRILREFFKSEGVWHFVDPREPSILKAYDPNRPHCVPENAVCNKPKPNVEEDLLEFEHEILHELEVKKAQNLELVELNLNPWLTHPELTTIYQGLLVGNPIPARNLILPTPTPRRRRSRREATFVLVPTRLRSGKIIKPEIFSDDEQEPLNSPVPEVPGAYSSAQPQEPLHNHVSTVYNLRMPVRIVASFFESLCG
jgi:hypothetical protein